MCLGASFAQMSVTLMAATLLQRFKFRPVRPNSQLIPVQYDITMNFEMTHGLHMEVEPRVQDVDQYGVLCRGRGWGCDAGVGACHSAGWQS
jgi:hypothetical protein